MAKANALSRLHALVVEAAQDGFAQVEAEGLGEKLREATEALLAELGDSDELHAELRHLRGGLDAFEQRGRIDRSRIVSHALRLCATVRSRQRAAQPKPKKAKATKAQKKMLMMMLLLLLLLLQ